MRNHPMSWGPQRRTDSTARGDGGGAASPVSPTWGLLARALFWSWNGLLSCIAVFGLAPLLGVTFIRDTVRGTLPPSLLVGLLLLIAVPLASLALGWRARRAPWRLLAILYGVEVPVLAIGIVRIFVVREVTPQVAVMASLVALGLVAFASTLWNQEGRHNAVIDTVRFACTAVLGLVALAVAVLLAAYAALVLLLIVKHLASHGVPGPGILVPVLCATALIAYAATISLGAPFVALAVYVRTLRSLARRLRSSMGRGIVVASVVAFALVTGMLVQRFATQPHERAFALLARTPRDDGERRALLDASATIRDGLLDAYLAPYRYASTEGDTSALAELCAGAFGGYAADYPRAAAFSNVMLAPFTFASRDPQTTIDEAATSYAAFFDAPISSAEADRITRAQEASFDRGHVEAGLIDRDAERVHVLRQDVDVTPHGDWAELELHEEYVNTTSSTQEVVYHFTLPESAALTGLWLGDSSDKASANTFTVAPRGAAQKVYRAEVQRRVDPALLEQVGPRQYRLRIFPILPDTSGEEAPHTHMWLALATMRDGARYPVPSLAERRNAFFTSATVRTLNDAPADWDAWFPATVPASDGAMHDRTVALDGFNVHVGPKTAIRPVVGEHIAVVVDRSRSMSVHANSLTIALAAVRDLLGQDNDVELMLPSPRIRGESPIRRPFGDLGPVVFYGGQSLSEALRQSASDADLTIVLTDDDGVKHERDDAEAPKLSGALWIVHLDDSIATAYADSVSDLLARPGSGVATSVREAVERYSASKDGLLVDGDTVWSLAATPGTPGDDGFDTLAARALVRLAGQGWVARDLHGVAVAHHVVTPLSSMLVLVNERQERALSEASDSPDAFDRDTETGDQPPPFMTVTGVPEPEEWLLIACVGGLLLVATRRRLIPAAQRADLRGASSRARFG